MLALTGTFRQGSAIHATEIVFLLLLLFVVVFGILARKLKVPYPIVLVIGGLLLSFVPGIPKITLDPDIVFLVILPPLLYSAAWLTSWREFSYNLVSILFLAFGLVAFTVLGVALAVHWFLPGFDWRMGIVLGAVVAPTDAIAATSIANRIGLPKRIVDVLEGESLVNDATALLALEFGLAILVGGGTPTVVSGVLRLLYLIAAGIGVGLKMRGQTGTFACFLKSRARIGEENWGSSRLSPSYDSQPCVVDCWKGAAYRPPLINRFDIAPSKNIVGSTEDRMPVLADAYPTYQKIFDHTDFVTPTVDLGLPDSSGNLHKLGKLKEGQSLTPPPFQSKFEPTKDGLNISVLHNREDVGGNTARSYVSKTLYLVTGRLNELSNIVAFLSFDMPNSHRYGEPDSQSLNKWAVGLNIKDGGNEDNGPKDTVLGPTCQFHDGGQIRMHTSDDTTVLSIPQKTYAGIADALVQLTLVLRINRATKSASGELLWPLGFLGEVTTEPQPITVPTLNVGQKPWLVNAIGFSVVNAPGPDSLVSVRIKGLSIWAS